MPRYHQIRNISPVSNQENLNDHGFPVPGYLLATSGYMFLEPSQWSTRYTKLEIFSSSIYDQESPTEYLDFSKMVLNGHKGTIFQLLYYCTKNEVFH